MSVTLLYIIQTHEAFMLYLYCFSAIPSYHFLKCEIGTFIYLYM